MDITYGNKTFKNEKSSGEVILQLFGTCFFHKIILQVLIYIEISLVNLLQIALPITGYNRLLDWKLVYRDGNAGNIAVGASKWAQVGVRGVISAKKKGRHPPLDTTQI